MTAFNETINVIATARGATRGGLVAPGEKFEVIIRKFSDAWMKPATAADRKKLDEAWPEWLEFKAAKAAEGTAGAGVDAMQRKVEELEAKVAAAEKTAADEKKRADKAEADLAALNKKIDDAQKKSAASKATASKTT